jgi:PKD repeat protein
MSIKTRFFTAWFLAISLTGVVALAALLSRPAQAEPGHGPLIRLARATFDPLVGLPRLPGDLTLQSLADGGLYLVQFDGPIQAAWKDDLRRANVRLFDYVPDYAFLAWMDGSAASRAAALPHVRWVGPYQPAYRLSPRLDGATGRQNITLLALPTLDEAALVARLQALGASVHAAARNEFGAYLNLTVDAAQLPALAQLPPVVWLEPYSPPRLLNDVARGPGIMNAEQVWQDLGLYGAGQIVAICDSGLDVGVIGPTMNDDFEGRILAFYDLSGDGSLDRCSGHGTHVAGSVLGNGANSGSDPANHDYAGSYAGLAPEAQLIFQSIERYLAVVGCLTWGLPFNLNDLFQPTFDAGARIHTNSWGGAGSSGEYNANSQQTDQFAWTHPDFTILFSAGNTATDGDGDGVVDADSILAPGTAKNCITVGASENLRPTPSPNPDSGAYGASWPDDFPAEPIFSDAIADAPSGMAAFSSRGPTDDGRIKPDLVAPGTWILSAYSQAYHPDDGGSQEDGWGTPPNRWYKYMGGTSMATPLAAGAATLVRDYYNDVAGLASPSSALVKATLVNGAYDMTPGQYGPGAQQELVGRPDNAQGWGRVDLANSLLPTAPRSWWYDDHSAGLHTGDALTYTSSLTRALIVTDSNVPLRVSLVWTDYPGTPAAAGGLVNDLDLEVIGPYGVHHYGNGAAWDRVNNVEGVDVLNPALGPYTIVVHAHNVAQGTQPYALVVSGVLGQSPCAALESVSLTTTPGLETIRTGQGVPFTATVMPLTGTALLPINYAWNLGAAGYGSGLDGPTPVFTYTEAGTHTIVVTASNCGGVRVTDSLEISVQPACLALTGIQASADDPVELGQALHLQTSITPTYASPPITYTWNLGAPGYGHGADGPSPVFTYTQAGTHTVVVSAANCGGAGLAVDALDVLVNCTAPGQVDFAWGPRPVYVGVSTVFTASVGSGALPLSYTWRFGDDGSQASGPSQVVSHTFELSGAFPVSLTVANPCGSSAPLVRQVSVALFEPGYKVFLPLVLKRP